MYFRREVRSGVRKAGLALQDPDIPMPWEVDLCQYHTHNDMVVCERVGAEGLQSLEEPAPQSLPVMPRRSPRTTAVLETREKMGKPQKQKKR